jgi:hypothetical protein
MVDGERGRSLRREVLGAGLEDRLQPRLKVAPVTLGPCRCLSHIYISTTFLCNNIHFREYFLGVVTIYNSL